MIDRNYVVSFCLSILLFFPVVVFSHPGALIKVELSHDSIDRSYYVFLPSGYQKGIATPLVLALHGGGGTSWKFDHTTKHQFTKEAEKRGWLLVFPTGIEKGWNDGHPPVVAKEIRRSKVDDVGFLSAIIDRVDKDYGIDRKRVYLTGISMGGFMSGYFAIKRPEQVAAIGVVAATIAEVHRDMQVSTPVSVLHMHGTLDPVIPYAGGKIVKFGRERANLLSTDESIEWWLRQNNCTHEKQVRQLSQSAPFDKTDVEVESYDSCSNGASVVLYRINGGGHAWPGGNQTLPKSVIGPVSKEINGAEHIFDFFAKHSLP